VALTVRLGSLSLADKMLELGARFDPRNPRNHKLLHLAAREGKCEEVGWLIKHGIPVDSVDEEGCTPLLWTILEEKLECMQRLIKEGSRTTHPIPGAILYKGQKIFPQSLMHAAVFSKNPAQILNDFIINSEQFHYQNNEGH